MNLSLEEDFPEFENASSSSEKSLSPKDQGTRGSFNVKFADEVDAKYSDQEDISIELASKETRINPALLKISQNHDPSRRRSSRTWKDLLNDRSDLMASSVRLEGKEESFEDDDAENDNFGQIPSTIFNLQRQPSTTKLKALQYNQQKAYANNNTVQGSLRNMRGSTYPEYGPSGLGMHKQQTYIGCDTLQIRKPLGNFCNLVLALILCFISIPLYHLKKDDDTVVYYICTFLGISFLCAISDAWKYLIWVAYPALEINETGIMDNYTVPERTGTRPDRFGYGMITWGEIQNVEIWTDVTGACSLVISLKNYEEFKEKLIVNGCCENDDSLARKLEFNRVDLPDNTHLHMNFGKDLDCDILYAYGRIIEFFKLKEFKDKRLPTKYLTESHI